MFPGLPMAWLYGGIAACVALFGAYVTVRHNAQVAAARDTGVGVGQAATPQAPRAAATEIAQIKREAEAEAPRPVDKAAKEALCKQRKGVCRDWARLQQ
jgi:hypothetical protein